MKLNKRHSRFEPVYLFQAVNRMNAKQKCSSHSLSIDLTSEPQDEMEGPISSLVNGVKKEAEKNDKESEKQATKKRDERM